MDKSKKAMDKAEINLKKEDEKRKEGVNLIWNRFCYKYKILIKYLNYLIYLLNYIYNTLYIQNYKCIDQNQL